ncbi:MAG TPA: hypothetical protein VFU36_16250 [Jatrophihabitans sp.]|nr:hypothetical protein [Jatrophihabitans sp.]
MVAFWFELSGFLLFVALVAAFYVWTRRVEADSIYEPREKSEDEANALRLGIALNASNTQLGGH